MFRQDALITAGKRASFRGIKVLEVFLGLPKEVEMYISHLKLG